MFIARIIILAGILGIATGGVFLYDYIKNKSRKTALPTKSIWAVNNDKIPELRQKDSNGNEIPDWEESLWGLDPKGNGITNKATIEEKKNKQRIDNPDGTSSEIPEDETDQLAREFFSSFMALKQSGNLSKEAIEEISSNIGSTVGDTELADKYTLKDVRAVASTDANMLKYKKNMEKIISENITGKMGEELDIVDTITETEDDETKTDLIEIASGYKKLAEKLIAIDAPRNIAGGHLDITNRYEKMGNSIEKMSLIISNPIAGITGIVMYQRYTDEIIQIVESIGNVLNKNDTI